MTYSVKTLTVLLDITNLITTTKLFFPVRNESLWRPELNLVMDGRRILLQISLMLVLQTCLTAHYGLWKGCTKTLWVADIDPARESCGPAELPGGDSKTERLVCGGWMSNFNND